MLSKVLKLLLLIESWTLALMFTILLTDRCIDGQTERAVTVVRMVKDWEELGDPH